MSRKKKRNRTGAPSSARRGPVAVHRKGAPREQDRARGTRPIMPARRPRSKKRWLVWGVLVIVYVTVMWYLVFPWVDRTFVNQPAL